MLFEDQHVANDSDKLTIKALKKEGGVLKQAISASMAYIARPHHSYIESLPIPWINELCLEAIFGNLGVFKSCHFWQILSIGKF